jgi:hypothetical protein
MLIGDDHKRRLDRDWRFSWTRCCGWFTHVVRGVRAGKQRESSRVKESGENKRGLGKEVYIRYRREWGGKIE